MTSEQCKKGEDRQISYFSLLRSSEKLDMVGHIYNPSTQKLRHEKYQEFEVSLGYEVRPISNLKQNSEAWFSLKILQKRPVCSTSILAMVLHLLVTQPPE